MYIRQVSLAEVFFTFTLFKTISTQINITVSPAVEEMKELKEKEIKFLKSLGSAYHCKMQKNENVCSTAERTTFRYYFDMQTRQCERFSFGHCKDVFNIYHTKSICNLDCRDEIFTPLPIENLTRSVVCRLQPEFGDCANYHPSFYYNLEQQKCIGFAYSGCGGNLNRFSTKNECADACGMDTFIRCD